MQVHSFYLFSWTDIETNEQAEWPFHRVPYDRDRASELYEQYIQQIQRSEELGFDGVLLNEHHYSAYSMDPSPMVLGSHIAARTEDLRIGFLGNVIPIREQPIRVAEEIAVLDTISSGRVIAGMARGIPKEYLAYNIPGPIGDGPNHSRGRFEEAVRLVQRAWTTDDPFDWDGEHFQYEDVYIWPKPYQQPRPNMWMPASSEQSLRFAAERRMSVACAGSTDDMRDGFETYERIAEEEFGWEPSLDNRVYPRRIFVGETTEQARESARAHMEFHWKRLFGGVMKGTATRAAGDERYDPATHESELSPYVKQQMDFDFDAAVDSGAVAVGEPAEVLQSIERQYEEIDGAGHLACTVHHGDAPHETTMGSIERFGDEVLPELKKL